MRQAFQTAARYVLLRKRPVIQAALQKTYPFNIFHKKTEQDEKHLQSTEYKKHETTSPQSTPAKKLGK